MPTHSSTFPTRGFEFGRGLFKLVQQSKPLARFGQRFLGGSAESLVMSLVETKHLNAEKLSRLNRLVKKSEEERDESH